MLSCLSDSQSHLKELQYGRPAQSDPGTLDADTFCAKLEIPAVANPIVEVLERDAYLDERKLLIDLTSKANQDLDKALITLSAGAIGFSIAFVKQFSQSPLQHRSLLFTTWALLSGSLTSVLLSFFFSQFSLKRMQKNLDAYYENQNDPGTNPWSRVTNALNFASLLTFTVGVILLAVFVGKNLA